MSREGPRGQEGGGRGQGWQKSVRLFVVVMVVGWVGGEEGGQGTAAMWACKNAGIAPAGTLTRT